MSDRLELPALFPLAFSDGQPKPLAIGIRQQILTILPEGVSKTHICKLLRRYTRQPGYLQAVAAPGSARFNLDGSLAGPVSGNHAAHALTVLQASAKEANT